MSLYASSILAPFIVRVDFGVAFAGISIVSSVRVASITFTGKLPKLTIASSIVIP